MPANNVNYYQRYFQAHRNTALWMRHPRSKLIVYPFYALFTYGCVGVPLYFGARAWVGIKDE